jgi:guanylate kinase
MKNIIKSKEKGNLIVISGPSGSGKGTIIKELLSINKKLWLSISMTTRNIRPGDIPNESYYFLTREEFESRIKEDKFLEYAEYNGNYYGTPKDKIEDYLNKGIDVILEIEIQGALKIKEKVKDAIFIFIMPPSLKELKRRLIGRNTETIDKVISRFTTAYKEINEVTKYNYVVVNDEIHNSVEKVNSIIISEKCRVDRIEEIYLNNMEEEIHELLVEKDLQNNDRVI